MKKLWWLIVMMCALAVLSACKESPKPERYAGPTQQCVQVCVDAMFDGFHSKGESWGTTSSSMDGMQQSMTLQLVVAYCSDLYYQQPCCVASAYYPSSRLQDAGMVVMHDDGDNFKAGYCMGGENEDK